MPEYNVEHSTLVPPVKPKLVLNSRNPSKLQIEISIIKQRPGRVTPIREDSVRLSDDSVDSVDTGGYTATIDPTYHRVNSFYNNQDYSKQSRNQASRKNQDRSNVWLRETRSELYGVHVPPPEVEDVTRDLFEGSFDVVATSDDATIDTNGLYTDKLTPGNLVLLRIWRTDKLVTYNRFSGRIEHSPTETNRPHKSETDQNKFLPDIFNRNNSVNGAANYYKKYLIEDAIDRKLTCRESKQPPRNPNSLPELQQSSTLQRSPSFVSDTGPRSVSLYRRYNRREIPIKASLAERNPPPRLTRSNILRHEYQEKLRRLQSTTVSPTKGMDQNRAIVDAEDALQEQNLKCPVCRNYYDTGERNPHVLHCLHTCCHDCLRSRVRADMVQCPVCNEVNEVLNNDVDHLPVDHAREHLVKYYKAKYRTSELGCDSCDPRNRASHRCRECDEFLCSDCTEAHRRTKLTKGHAVVSVEALRRANLDEFHHKRTCQEQGHDDQHFSFYCYSKGCDKPICSLCAVTQHNKADGHDIRNINDVYIENKRVVEGLLIDVKHKQTLADEAIQSIEDEIQNLYIKESSTDEELEQTFLTCQKLLEKRKNDLKEKLTATCKAKKKGMESQLDKLIFEKNSLDHSAKFTSNVLVYSDATEFLQMKEALFGRLCELKELEVDTRPHNKADLKFHGHRMVEEFQKYAGKMGEVWSTTAFIPNTKIQTYDVTHGREETAMMITLHDYERRPLAEPGVDIRVEVINPAGKKTRAQVVDLSESEGAYKVSYQGSHLGDHRASVFIMGMPVIDPGVMFKVRRQSDLENDIEREYEPASELAHVKAKVDTGLKEEDDNPDDKNKGRTKSYRVFGDIICPDFSFDAPTCHAQNMVTSDSRTLKNIRGRTANVGTAFKNYRGVLGSRPFSKVGRFYFEVVVYFFIKRQLRNDLIFEVALSRKSEIDKNYTVDGSPYAWTVCARRCPLCRTVCLMTFHNGIRLYHVPLTENSPPGTTLRTTIGFLVDMKQKQWFVVDAKNRRLFYRFKNIDTTKPLWPVFGAYSNEYVSVSLALKTGKDVQAVPDIPSEI